MLPPFGASPYDRPNTCFLPELRPLITHQPLPTLGEGQVDSPERVSAWDRVKRYLQNGFFHHTGHAIDKFVEEYKCLNARELEEITDAIYTLEDEVHDITSHMGECLDMVAYCQMVLRSRDPEVDPHRELIKKQLEHSTARYERYQLAWQHFHKEESKLWAIWSEETKRTRDFVDAQPGMAENNPVVVSD